MQLSDRELATVLAALRGYEKATDEAYRKYGEHFRHNDTPTITPLTNAEIDDLCERLNTEVTP